MKKKKEKKMGETGARLGRRRKEEKRLDRQGDGDKCGRRHRLGGRGTN